MSNSVQKEATNYMARYKELERVHVGMFFAEILLRVSFFQLFFFHFGHWERWIGAKRIAFLNVLWMKEITVGAVIRAAWIFRCSAYNASLFGTQLKKNSINKMKIKRGEVCFAGMVGVFISAFEMNISSCHLSCVLLCFSTILSLHYYKND